MRIVTLTCSNTEIVCALGCADMLVGVDDHSDYPPDVVNRLPRVGPDLTIDMDKVAALKPDLVLASLTVPGHEKVIAELQTRGLPYLAPEPVSLADVYSDIRLIAGKLGVGARGATVIGDMQTAMPATLPGNSQDCPSILVQWWPKPIIAPGKHSWVDDLITAAGGVNPLGKADVKSRPLRDDEVARLNPDAIVISWCGVELEKYRDDVIYHNPNFKDMTAVRERRVFKITEAYLGRPSPRLVDGYRALRAIVTALQPSTHGSH